MSKKLVSSSHLHILIIILLVIVIFYLIYGSYKIEKFQTNNNLITLTNLNIDVTKNPPVGSISKTDWEKYFKNLSNLKCDKRIKINNCTNNIITYPNQTYYNAKTSPTLYYKYSPPGNSNTNNEYTFKITSIDTSNKTFTLDFKNLENVDRIKIFGFKTSTYIIGQSSCNKNNSAKISI